MSPLRWTTKRTRKLAEALTEAGHRVSHVSVGELLREAGYSLQSKAKSVEGKPHPDRDGQFRYLNALVKRSERRGPGDLGGCEEEGTGGRTLASRTGAGIGNPKVNPCRSASMTSRPGPGQGRPLRHLRPVRNAGWVTVGQDHDTAASPSPACGAGGGTSDRSPIPTRSG